MSVRTASKADTNGKTNASEAANMAGHCSREPGKGAKPRKAGLRFQHKPPSRARQQTAHCLLVSIAGSSYRVVTCMCCGH